MKTASKRIYANSASDGLKEYFVKLTRASKIVKFKHQIKFLNINLGMDSFRIEYRIDNNREENFMEIPIDTPKYMKNRIFDYLNDNYAIDRILKG